MTFASLTHGLIYAGLGLQLGLAALLLTKRLWRRFPFFVLYSVWNLSENGVLFAVSHSRTLYFYAYWIFECVAVLLGIAVVYEVFQHLLAAHVALHKLARWVFQGVIVSLVLLGAAVIYLQPPGTVRGLDGLLIAEQAARVVQLGLLMFLFLFSSVFGLHWRQHEFGVALGLGVFLSVALIAVTMKTHTGPVAAQVLGFIRGVAFDSSMLIWLGYILVPERAASSAGLPQRAQLEQWNQAMMELINQ